MTENISQERLCQFIKDYLDDLCCLELLLFFGRHPHTRFSRLAIVHALNARRLDIERALQRLTKKQLLQEYADNGVHYYGLTEDESLCCLALVLTSLDWNQWQVVLRKVYPVPLE